MIWIAIGIWAVIVAAACGLSFLLIVAGAFGRRENAVTKPFNQIVLGVGRKVGGGNPVIVLGTAWLMWTAIGAAILVGLFKLP